MVKAEISPIIKLASQLTARPVFKGAAGFYGENIMKKLSYLMLLTAVICVSFSIFVCAEECSNAGETQDKYLAGQPDECSYTTQTRTCCRSKIWSAWGEACPQCSEEQCWNGSECEDKPESTMIVGEDRYDGSECAASCTDFQCVEDKGWKCSDSTINYKQGGYFGRTQEKKFPIPSSNPSELSGACPRYLRFRDNSPEEAIAACELLAKNNYRGDGSIHNQVRTSPDGTRVFFGACEIRSNCACYEGSSKKFNNLVCTGAYPTTSLNVSWKCSATQLVCGARECGNRADDIIGLNDL